MGAASCTLILGSIIQQSIAILEVAVGTTTGKLMVSADQYLAGFEVCGVIEPLLWVVAAAVTLGATVVIQDAKAKCSTFSRWNFRKQTAK